MVEIGPLAAAGFNADEPGATDAFALEIAAAPAEAEAVEEEAFVALSFQESTVFLMLGGLRPEVSFG